jgi:Plant mobile domain
MSILERFHLNHLARINTIKIDRNLINVMVERWRREAHTFHLRVGEMIVTIEDVSCLWGLPIDGLPVIGFPNNNWEHDVFDAFGRVDWSAFRRPSGTYHLSANWLCEPWGPPIEDENDLRRSRASLPDNASAEEARYYTHTYMLDLFSSVIFPDHSRFIQTMHLHLIRNPDSLSTYS